MFVVRLEPISPTETREYASLLVHPSLLDDGTATDSTTGEILTPEEIEKRLDAMWDFYMETNGKSGLQCIVAAFFQCVGTPIVSIGLLTKLVCFYCFWTSHTKIISRKFPQMKTLLLANLFKKVYKLNRTKGVE